MKDEIQKKLKEAMLARDSFLKDVLAGLKSAITYEEVAKGKKEQGLTDDEILAVIAREVKKRDDTIEIYVAAGNKDLAEKEAAEREILQTFLPEQLSEQELTELIERIITTTGATDIKDMGRVIGAVKAEAGARADGSIVARLVRARLQ
jgi:uncharacterized protein YqeY